MLADAMYKIVRHTPSLFVTYRKGSFGETIATISKVTPSPDRLNDMMVSIASAEGRGGFDRLVTHTAALEGPEDGHNHSDIANERVANTVIRWILSEERNRGGLR